MSLPTLTRIRRTQQQVRKALPPAAPSGVAPGAGVGGGVAWADPGDASRGLAARNPVYRPASETRARYRLVYGGAGSGKSVFVAQDELARVAADPRQRLLVLRKVARTCRHSTFQLFRDILAATGLPADVNKTEMTIQPIGGGQIIHAGLDDVQKLKSITGITRIWVEEATELEAGGAYQEPDLAQIDLRLRGVAQELVPQITLTFNPTLAARHLLAYAGFPEADLPSRSYVERGGVYVQHTTYLDNPHVGNDYTAVFRRLGGAMQTVYEHGQLANVDAPDQLIRYAWVKAAFERAREEAAHDGRQRLACDPARYGTDEAVIGRFEGWTLVHVESHPHISNTDIGRRVASLAREYDVPAELTVFDEVNLSGALDTCRDEGIGAKGFIGGASPVEYVEGLSDLTFNNLRSQAWFFLRLQLQNGCVAFSPDLDDETKRKLQEDLLAPRYRTGQEKRIEVEPKEGTSATWGLKHRLGRSPDYGDTVMMGLFAEHVPAQNDFEVLGWL